MHILVFYPYIPYPLDRGTFQRTFHLLRELALEHTVDLLCLSENGERMEHRAVFEQFCNKVRFISFEHPPWARLPKRLASFTPTSVQHWALPQVETALDEMLAETRYDFVHACDIVLAQYFMSKHRDVPLAVDRSRVDLLFQLTQLKFMTKGWRKKLLDLECIAKVWLFEKRVARRASVEVVCGPDDEAFMRANISKRVPIKVIANGVDLEYFHPDSASDPRAEKPTILFCGAMDYTPNIDALRWYFSEIHELLRAQIADLQVFIVGKAPLAEVQAYGKKQGVTITGGVPDVRPFYRRAWIQIVPLRIGGGTRLKIVESLAIGTPVVSTTIGAQGLDLIHNEDILLADSPEEFANETARALLDASLRNQIEARGMKTVNLRLAWPMLGCELSMFYRLHFNKTTQQQHSHEQNIPDIRPALGTADIPARSAV